MSPHQRAQGLAAAARVLRGQLLELAGPLAERGDVVIDRAPEAAAVMTTLRSPLGEHCLAEVVVTLADITTDEGPGWGCVLGWDAEGALAAALLDSAEPETADLLAAAALAVEEGQRAERAAETRLTRMEVA
jgi:alpha-D-ribose 1-methylphosphonate 5-triphosphate synthase subunit PhnG